MLQELVSALHGLVLLYEKQFQIAALRNTDAEQTGSSHVSTSLTATGWIHVSIEPVELETSLDNEGKNSTHSPQNSMSRSNLTKSQSPPVTFSSSPGSGDDRLVDSFPKKKGGPAAFMQSSSPSSISSASGKNFYTQVWKGMIFLASDPNPSVARMAQHVVHGVHDKVGLLCVPSTQYICLIDLIAVEAEVYCP